MRKLFAKIHLWLSIPLGLILSLICFTGAILVFDTEISEKLYPERYFVQKVEGKAMALDKLVPLVNAQLKNNSVTGVQVPSDPERNYVMTLAQGRRVSAYVNPYTGKVVEVSAFMDSFFGKVMGLHRWLLFGARDLGRNMVGYTTLFFVFILISGIVIWWPRSWKMLKSRLRVKTKYGIKRFFYDSHVSLGIYASVILLALALTGLTWSFNWYRKGFYAVFGVKMEQRSGDMMMGEGAPSGDRPPKGEGRNPHDAGQKPEQVGNAMAMNGMNQEKRTERAGVPDDAMPEKNKGGRPPKGEGRNPHGAGQKPEQEENAMAMNGMNEEKRTESAGVPDDAMPEKNKSGRLPQDAGSGDEGGMMRHPEPKQPKAIDLSVWQIALDNLKAKAGDYKYITINNGKASVMQLNQLGNVRATDKYSFDVKTGKITDVKRYADMPDSAKIRGWIYSVHVGAWGGLVTKILTFLAALLGGIFPLTGYYIYFLNRKKKWARK